MATMLMVMPIWKVGKMIWPAILRPELLANQMALVFRHQYGQVHCDVGMDALQGRQLVNNQIPLDHRYNTLMSSYLGYVMG